MGVVSLELWEPQNILLKATLQNLHQQIFPVIQYKVHPYSTVFVETGKDVEASYITKYYLVCLLFTVWCQLVHLICSLA